MSESAKRRCENPEWIASQIARYDGERVTVDAEL